MVLRGEMTTATTRPERAKALHNFALPNLKWGSQRQLKCMRIDSLSGGGSGDHRLRRRSPPLRFSGSIPFRFGESDHRWSRGDERHRLRSAPFESGENGGEGEGIGELRVKLISDLKTVSDKIAQSMFRKEVTVEQDEERKPSGQEKEISPAKPWNLRKRKEPLSGNESNKGFVAMEERTVNPRNKAVKEGGGGVVAEEAETKKEKITTRPKFSGKLSKKEIEEDFMAMAGHRPPRRPKKRPRTIQRQIDNLYPALYLTEVTLDSYKVP